mgnify:CR=1 FL=1
MDLWPADRPVGLEAGDLEARLVGWPVRIDRGDRRQALVVAGEDGGELEHVSYIGWGSGVRHQATIRASAGKDARVRSVNVTLGGDVVRVEISGLGAIEHQIVAP